MSTPSSPSPNVVLLGCGRVAARHAAVLRRIHPEVKLSFASRDLRRAEAYVKRFSGDRAFGSYDEALADSKVDAVLILTPPRWHLELTRRALSFKKHVLVEKPPFVHSTDFDIVIEEARHAERQVMVAENYFYKPLLITLRKLLTEGVIGDILFLHINAIKKQRTGDWRDDPELAVGGALYEGGIHWMNFVANLGLTVQRVTGFRPALAQGSNIERSMMVGLEYAEGAVGMVSYSWEVPSLLWGIRLSKIYGRQGTITFETNGLWVLVHGKKNRFIIPGLRDLTGGQAMLRDFVAAIRDNRAPEFTLVKAKRDLEIIEEAYASADHPPSGLMHSSET